MIGFIYFVGWLMFTLLAARYISIVLPNTGIDSFAEPILFSIGYMVFTIIAYIKADGKEVCGCCPDCCPFSFAAVLSLVFCAVSFIMCCVKYGVEYLL